MNALSSRTTRAPLSSLQTKEDQEKKTLTLKYSYFFYRDCIDKEDSTVKYSTTKHIITEFFTKPLNQKL